MVEAQPHRRGGDGELPLLDRGEFDRLGEPVPELGILLAEVLILLDQLGTSGPALVLGHDGGLDLTGVIRDGLSAAVDAVGLVGDMAVGAIQAGGGVGDPSRDGHLEHGMGLGEHGLRKQSHSGDPPPRTIKTSYPVSRNVNLRIANSIRFGTVPR